MPVNDLHPELRRGASPLEAASRVLTGEDSVKAAGEVYLARLEGQTDAEFAAYAKRPSFFNATARTSEGFVGMIFRSEGITKLAGAGPMVALVADVDSGHLAGFRREFAKKKPRHVS
jgi:hypothetical protein